MSPQLDFTLINPVAPVKVLGEVLGVDFLVSAAFAGEDVF